MLAHLADHGMGLASLAACARHLLVHLLGADEGWQRAGYAGEDAHLALRLPLRVLDTAPVADDLLRIAHLDIGEDVRMAPDELVGDAPRDIGDREAPGLGGEL